MGNEQLRAGAIALLGGLLLVACAVLVGSVRDAAGARDPGAFKRVTVVEIDGARGADGEGVAMCPKGTRAISGGWAMSDAEETRLLVITSRRVGIRGWSVAAIQATSDSFLTDLLPTAYCDSRARRSRPVSAAGSVPSGETGSVDATCPAGRKAVAGGFTVPTTSDFSRGGFPIASRRAGQRTWRVTVYAPTPQGATVTAYAYCARRSGKLRSRYASKSTRDPGRHAAVRSGKCPKRIGVRAGGFAIRDTTVPMFSIPTSVREGRRWEVWARNLNGTETRLTAVAYCH
jgi:hypothetical protein